MRGTKLLIACFAMLVATAGQVQAGLIAFETSGGGINPFDNITNGNRFTVLNAVTIDSLGVIDVGLDGFSESHQVGIWTDAGGVVATATVPSGTSATLINEFRFTPITPVVLSPGTYRYGAFFSGDDVYRNGSTVISSHPDITFLYEYVRHFGAGFAFPETIGGTTSSTNVIYNTASFTVVSAPIPEPTSLAIFGIGALGMVVRHRRKQKLKA